MVSMIVGNRGTGKTKKLIDQVRKASERSDGNVVCIERGKALRANISYHVRHIDIKEYNISGEDRYYGFLAGLLAGNYDITDIFCDATFKILCGKDQRDFDDLTKFVDDLNALAGGLKINIVLSVSCDQTELPERLRAFIQKS